MKQITVEVGVYDLQLLINAASTAIAQVQSKSDVFLPQTEAIKRCQLAIDLKLKPEVLENQILKSWKKPINKTKEIR